MVEKRPAASSSSGFLQLIHDERNSGWTSPRHVHPNYWELLLVAGGAVRAVTGRTESNGVAGSIFIRPPGAAHQEQVVSAEPLRIWVFSWIEPVRGKKPKPIEAFDTHGDLAAGLKWLYHLQGLLEPRHSMLNAVARTLVYSSLRAPARPSQQSAFAGAIEYMQRRIHQPITLASLAQASGMSVSRLSHEFTREFNSSPMTYLRRLRLERACRDLTQTNKVMRQIAHEIGFRDEFEFSRVFRRVYGVAPSSLRRHMVKEPSPRRQSSK